MFAHPALLTTLCCSLTWLQTDAWITDGTLPTKAHFASYVGKFCFDYVANTSGATEADAASSLKENQEVFGACAVALNTQMSEAACVLDKTYGCRSDVEDIMWVSGGCRGDFTLNGAELTCDSWSGRYTNCQVPSKPTSGYLEVDVQGQMVENLQDYSANGHMFLMLFDDESAHWAHIKDHWGALTCQEMHDLSNGAYPVSSELSTAPFHVRHLIRIREHLRPRFWHFVFVNCGAKNALVPVKYTLHARNIRQGASAEFSIDAYKSVPLEVTFSFVFGIITFCSLVKVWRHMYSRPLLVLLCASASFSATGCCLLAIHHKAYATNGRGLILFEGLGMCCSCIAKLLFIILQFVIAKGWAFFLAPEDRRQLVAVVCALLGLAGLSTGCEVYGWFVQEISTELYLYDSWLGFVVLCVNMTLLVLAWGLTAKSASQEKSADVRMFYFRVSAAAGIYFASLPALWMMAELLAPWARLECTARVELCARLIATAALLFQLWPTRFQRMIDARLTGRLASFVTEDDIDDVLPIITSDIQSYFIGSASEDDEERVLTKAGLSLEGGMIIR